MEITGIASQFRPICELGPFAMQVAICVAIIATPNWATVDLSVVIFQGTRVVIQWPGYPVCVLAYNYRLGAVQAAAMR